MVFPAVAVRLRLLDPVEEGEDIVAYFLQWCGRSSVEKKCRVGCVQLQQGDWEG